MQRNRKAIVEAGYDAIADTFGEWSRRVVDPGRDRLLADIRSRLAPGSTVLDLGCGSGVPATVALAEAFQVTGVDISEPQLERARRNVPSATFIHGDMATVEFAAASFDAVTAFHSLSHLPREEHAALLARIWRWLRPAGLLLVTMSARGTADWTGEWLGTEMFFSGFDAAENRRLVQAAGFELLVADVIEAVEPEGPVPFLWVLARKT